MLGFMVNAYAPPGCGLRSNCGPAASSDAARNAESLSGGTPSTRNVVAVVTLTVTLIPDVFSDSSSCWLTPVVVIRSASSVLTRMRSWTPPLRSRPSFSAFALTHPGFGRWYRAASSGYGPIAQKIAKTIRIVRIFQRRFLYIRL